MDDTAACIDLCEANGFAEPARVLRAIAAGEGFLHFVRPREDASPLMHSGIDLDDPTGAGPGERAFLDRAEAEACATRLTAAALRQYAPPEYLRGCFAEVAVDEFCLRVGAILGAPYRLPGDWGVPLFAASGTDAQLAAIAPMITFYPFYEVVRVPIVP